MLMPRKFWINGTVAIGLAVVLLVFSARAFAADDVQQDATKPQRLELVVDKAFVLPIPETVRESGTVRVTIASPGNCRLFVHPGNGQGSSAEVHLSQGEKAGDDQPDIVDRGEACGCV